MRVWVAVAVVGLAMSGARTVARAQEGEPAVPRPGQGAVAGRRGALAGIRLSEAQKSSIKALNQQFAQQLRTLRQEKKSGAGPNPQLRADVRRIALQKRADIRNLLTVDQRVRYDANLKALRRARVRHQQMKTQGRA